MPPNYFVLEVVASLIVIAGVLRFVQWAFDRWDARPRHARRR